MPAVITTDGNVSPTGYRPSQTHRASRRIRTVFTKTSHLGARNVFFQKRSQFVFQRRRKRKNNSLFQLLFYGFIYRLVLIAQNHRQQTIYHIQIFVVVYIPNVSALGAFGEQRRFAFYVLQVTFAEGLRSQRNYPQNLFQKLIAFSKFFFSFYFLSSFKDFAKPSFLFIFDFFDTMSGFFIKREMYSWKLAVGAGFSITNFITSKSS